MTRATERAYNELQQAFDFYNQRLFNGELPDCLITFQRGKNTMGYFSFRRFVAADGSGKMIDEIALNPEYFPAYPLIEVMQTLVHEQCHMWQFHFGNPSRKTYHNAQWAAKMESIGLMPSSTGRPGGAKVGQKINDYPIPGGRFQLVTLELFQGQFALSWFDRFPVQVEQQKDMTAVIEQWRETLAQAHQNAGSGIDIEAVLSMALLPSVTPQNGNADSEVIAGSNTSFVAAFEDKPKRNKAKYQCPGCGAAVWGKAGLNIHCGDCEQAFRES
ncbi:MULTISPECIES: SprT-like domain-containing protein [Gammaproteobacteria]|jgi:predicted SprT family Zn-dependent metalloprotease|nr:MULTISPECIES: SprT-like domain-containing protein [Enterobacterales]ECX2982329.1 SprT family zinc-dependent metalloprotease [Salmonella enterica subsp. enterica serovar Enteritidis]EFU6067022.1 SprT family zinc-dependent metalloprotease [Salmonella enterica subsp. enterica serovar Agona]EIF1297072.1 SprT-like domain-containing protein [Salmonella enterica]EIF2004801.1 SprT-like domain-containing protein [Salmonella enterica subsp. enterica serovar Montevideo]EKB0025973.1 SprT-like domain-co